MTFRGFVGIIGKEKTRGMNRENWILSFKSGRVKFGFSEEGSLLSIIVTDMTDTEFRELKASFSLPDL